MKIRTGVREAQKQGVGGDRREQAAQLNQQAKFRQEMLLEAASQKAFRVWQGRWSRYPQAVEGLQWGATRRQGTETPVLNLLVLWGRVARGWGGTPKIQGTWRLLGEAWSSDISKTG